MPVALALVAVGTISCSTLSVDSSSDEKSKVVSARAQARWQAIINKDFDAAYDYLSPASRATMTRVAFKTMAARLAYRSAKVTGVECNALVCRVMIELTYDVPLMAGVRTPLQESWIIEKGQAWYVWVP